jgi:O-antigen ligase
MGLLIVLFPLAYYRLQRDNGLNLLPKIVLSGSGFTVVLAHTDTGLAVVLFNLVFLIYIRSRVYIKDVAAKHLLGLFPILLITTAIGIWFILITRWFSNSQPRVVQYVTAWQIWIENPIFGVGGFNSSILYNVNIHNILLSYLSELGILTAGMYFFVFVAVFIKLVHFYFRHEIQERDLCGAYICLLLSFHLYTSLTTVFGVWHIVSVFWMVIIIGIHEQSTGEMLGQLSLDDQRISD